ncbi:iron-containing alcohol dehydrogenase, partial [Moorena sp. SIO3B2]
MSTNQKFIWATGMTKQAPTSLLYLNVAPTQVVRCSLEESGNAIARLGNRPLILGGQHTLATLASSLESVLEQHQLSYECASYSPDCSEKSLAKLSEAVAAHQSDLIIGIGGGKALDTAKIL